MGNAWGRWPQSGINHYLHPDVNPGPDEKPTFDPSLGFHKPRKERVMVATPEELYSAKIAHKDRDYCAHVLLDYRSCRKDVFPWAVKCAHVKHDYLNCQYDDFVLRMKEYERERRLRVRAKERERRGG